MNPLGFQSGYRASFHGMAGRLTPEQIAEALITVTARLYHVYPPMRYGMPNMSYAEKFENNLYFLIPKEKIEQVKERILKN